MHFGSRVHQVISICNYRAVHRLQSEPIMKAFATYTSIQEFLVRPNRKSIPAQRVLMGVASSQYLSFRRHRAVRCIPHWKTIMYVGYVEAVRRSGLLLAIPLGAWLITWSPTELIELREVDWERRRGYEIASLLSEEARKDINVYITQETQGAVIELPRGTWSKFMADADATLAGHPPDPKWAAAMSRKKYFSMGQVAYFATHAWPFQEWIDRPEMARGYAYLRLNDEVNPPRLCASRVNASMLGSAPVGLVYPYHYLGWSIILVGLMVYAIVPWPRRSNDQLSTLTPCQAALADSVGYLLWGTFIGIWAALIHAQNLPGYGEAGQFIVLTLVCWGLASSGLVVLGFVVWYLSFQLRWDDAGIDLTTIYKNRRIKWQEVKRLSIKPIHYRAAEWIRFFGGVVLLFRPKAAGPLMVIQSQSVAFCLETEQGTFALDIGNASPQGLAQFAAACRSHSVPILDESYRIPPFEDYERTAMIWPVYLCLLIVAAVIGFFMYRSTLGLW